MQPGNRRAIMAAFFANLGIAIAKFVGFLVTGAASMLAEAAMKFEATSLTLQKGDVEVDAKSIMELLLLEATCGTELRLFADGPQAEEAVEELKKLFKAEFNVKL